MLPARPLAKKVKKLSKNPNNACIIRHDYTMDISNKAQYDNKTSDLDTWFQDHQMPISMRPHDSWNQNHGSKRSTTNYRRDFRDSITGEDFFENYLRRIHGAQNVSLVDGLEQRYNHRGDLVLNHNITGPKEFDVKLERKGAETGRHALEFGEYYSDYHGNIQEERAPGWFSSSKAHIIVPVVPMPDGTVIMYPYNLAEMRKFLATMAAQAQKNGYDMHGEHGGYDKAKILDTLSYQIENSRHTLGPINTLREGGYKRSRSFCVPYDFLIKNNLTKPYIVHFD